MDTHVHRRPPRIGGVRVARAVDRPGEPLRLTSPLTVAGLPTAAA